jgi:Cu(I)/Ag(I) efflux system membrane protein CusA/SilA
MKRIAAPMVGGLVTSAFLTLEIIPVIYTYWRGEQLLWRRLGEATAPILHWLERNVTVLEVAGAVLVAALVSKLYVREPGRWLDVSPLVAAAVGLAALAVYLLLRRRARQVLAALELHQGKNPSHEMEPAITRARYRRR